MPVLPEARRNEAKRFILLVDTIYDRKLRLVMSAEAAPEALYQGRRGNEAFEFQRTASRLDRNAQPDVARRLGGAQDAGPDGRALIRTSLPKPSDFY